jgi:hypothetical protein
MVLFDLLICLSRAFEVLSSRCVCPVPFLAHTDNANQTLSVNHLSAGSLRTDDIFLQVIPSITLVDYALGTCGYLSARYLIITFCLDIVLQGYWDHPRRLCLYLEPVVSPASC